MFTPDQDQVQVIASTYHSDIILRPKIQPSPIIIKRFKRPDDLRVRARWEAEVELLRNPNITLLIASSDDINLDIQLRHEPGHSLETYIDDQSWCTLTRHDATCILSQMSQALFHLHQMGMVHDDMKPDNIIYSPDHRHSTLIDFGAAYSELVKPAGYFNTSGTPPYAPPEYLRRIKGKKGDVWGLGVTVLFLMKEVELPAGEWILPHALEGEDRPRKEMVTWLKRVEGVRVGLGERKGVMGGLVGAMLEAEPDERIGSGGLVDRLDALQGRVIWEEV